mmetsp:Transcript_22532/g.48981  ORF Transcript_22532/g.48981 Transcript_22532/m.48981 type:complete len:160 (+) Transcript_22532:148-627(+)
MARGRRGGGMGARRPAARPAPPPSRPASTQATPAPAPAAPTPAPMQPQQSSGGGMLSGIGSTIAQGMAFGTGSAIAHQAVGAAVGAMSGGGSSGSSEQAAAPAPQQQQLAAPADNGVCASDKSLFFDCLKANNGDANSCSFLYEQLQNCQKQSATQTFY